MAVDLVDENTVRGTSFLHCSLLRVCADLGRTFSVLDRSRRNRSLSLLDDLPRFRQLTTTSAFVQLGTTYTGEYEDIET